MGHKIILYGFSLWLTTHPLAESKQLFSVYIMSFISASYCSESKEIWLLSDKQQIKHVQNTC